VANSAGQPARVITTSATREERSHGDYSTRTNTVHTLVVSTGNVKFASNIRTYRNNELGLGSGFGLVFK